MLCLKEKFNDASFNVFSCQFVVKEDGDYTIHNIDPDKLVEWDSVERLHHYQKPKYYIINSYQSFNLQAVLTKNSN
jgi:hypothetical protein